MLRDALPVYLADIREFDTILFAEQPEMDEVTAAVSAMPYDFSVFSLSAAGVRRWENILGISGMGADDLESRRIRIQTRVLAQIPITRRTLYAQLLSLCGEGGFILMLDFNAYSLKIHVALTSKSALADVKAFVSKVVPANLIVHIDLLYNQYSQLTSYTHGGLHAYTHYQLRNEALH